MLTGGEEHRPGRRWLFGTGAGLLIVSLLAMVGVYRTIVSKTREVAGLMVAQARQAFEQVEPLTGEEATALRTYKNEEHVERAQALGVDRVIQRDDVFRLIRHDSLVALQDNPLYVVEDMDYSVPYVTKSTANLLALIGVRFQESLQANDLPPYRFVITSATRTRADQEALGDVNGNAAETSSHEFGTTVDLHYLEFTYSPARDSLPEGFWIAEDLLRDRLEVEYSHLTEARQATLKALLGRVLRQLQREGKVLVIYERRQPVFHITLGKPVSRPDVRQASYDQQPSDPLARRETALAAP